MKTLIQLIILSILFFGNNEKIKGQERLSSNIQSDLKIYNVIPFHTEENAIKKIAFLNLSETLFNNENEESNKNSILTENDLKKDTVRLNERQRKIFFDKLKISESDKLFIYITKKDSILSFNIKDLAAIACMNIYGSEYYADIEQAYEFGFDLNEKIKNSDNFAYIGKTSPFQTGKLTNIIWSKIDKIYFPKNFNKNIIDESKRWWFNDIQSGQSFKFSANNLNYFIQDLIKNQKPKHRYLVVVDSKTKDIIYEKVLIDSEGTDLLPLKTEESKDQYYSQWTGKLFKNKPFIIYGFLSHSFGCPSIIVLDDTEPAIPILCDNRH